MVGLGGQSMLDLTEHLRGCIAMRVGGQLKVLRVGEAGIPVRSLGQQTRTFCEFVLQFLQSGLGILTRRSRASDRGGGWE